MLHCTMIAKLTPALHQHLEDVLGELQYARRTDNLSRLVHVTYWDVRRWARSAQCEALASRAADLIRSEPQPSRAACLAIVDDVIHALERIQAEHVGDGDDPHPGPGRYDAASAPTPEGTGRRPGHAAGRPCWRDTPSGQDRAFVPSGY